VKARLLIVISVTALALSAVVACGDSGSTEEGETAPMADSGITSLQKQDVTPGSGAEAAHGQVVRVHYTGWLYDANAADKRGRKFDSSKDRSEPFEFRLGAQEVIQGWDDGVAGMKVGGTRILTIPPTMGYGSSGAGGGLIPPNATLVFEVELLDVR
jgi:FKBP-type peptidyl-prolyl cis-trans isomerase